MKVLIDIKGSKINKEHWLINDLNYFNVNTRSEDFDELGISVGCKYIPAHKNTLGCTVGKRMTKEQQEEWEKVGNSVKDIFEIRNDDDAPPIPIWVNDNSINFLQDMQSLHDLEKFWTEEGLSITGRNKVRNIIKKYSLDKSILKQHIEWLE